jgi:hypothetical protein
VQKKTLEVNPKWLQRRKRLLRLKPHQLPLQKARKERSDWGSFLWIGMMTLMETMITTTSMMMITTGMTDRLF